MSEKSLWPEVVGKTIEEAKQIILKERSDAEFMEVPDNMCILTKAQGNLVKLYVNEESGIVTKPAELV